MPYCLSQAWLLWTGDTFPGPTAPQVLPMISESSWALLLMLFFLLNFHTCV